MEFLASDGLRGRGSGTPDELLAATYVASQLRQYGVAPAGDDGTYIQRATIARPTLTAPPELRFMTTGDGSPPQQTVWTHGRQMLALQLGESKFQGPLKRVDTENRSGMQLEAKGSVVAILGRDDDKVQAAVSAALDGGAEAVLAPASAETLKDWDERGKQLPKLPAAVEGEASAGLSGDNSNVFALSQEALANLRGVPDGTLIDFEGAVGKPETSFTWNALGKISGTDPGLRKSIILLTAHIDHLGVGAPVQGDNIYNGADDDASGTTAVLELARALVSRSKPRRTVMFAFFGSEEAGRLGATWFESHPPVPLSDMAADLEFEMIGRPDPEYPPDTLWMTGWERSNLGPVLAAHGAKLVADKRPEQHFFTRSDNYVLARKGVVAQTVSSFGLHGDYHQPSDDLAHIHFTHLTAVIGSLIRPVEWLVNSDFRPTWRAGGRP